MLVSPRRPSTNRWQHREAQKFIIMDLIKAMVVVVIEISVVIVKLLNIHFVIIDETHHSISQRPSSKAKTNLL